MVVVSAFSAVHVMVVDKSGSGDGNINAENTCSLLLEHENPKKKNCDDSKRISRFT